MMKSIRWGILSTAKIGRNHVIPAIQQSRNGSVEAIASRSIDRANSVADDLGIPTAFGSYEELLEDDSIDAIYNPLPNHLHLPWTLKALEAGKHVLCEKPIGLDAKEAAQLFQATDKYPDLKVMEAFMYRFHPQWKTAKQMIQDHEVGTVTTIHSMFTYYNREEDNIRNKPGIGGGALMDIGCYNISTARYLLDREPVSVSGLIDEDPDFGVDRKTSGILNFGDVTATFTCSTQTAPHQRLTVFGTEGILEIEIPFNAPAGQTVQIRIHKNGETRTVDIPPSNQYTLQAEAFADAVIHDQPVPTPLGDALANMKVIDAIFESSESGKAVEL